MLIHPPPAEEGVSLRAVIFANGVFNPSPLTNHWLAGSNLYIAADGGLRLCQQFNLLPDILIGDFDSLSEQEVQQMLAQGVQVRRYPARKDETDLELALQAASEQAVDEIVILGGLGARWDQTLANLLLPAHRRFRHIPVVLVDGVHEIYMLNAPPTCKRFLQGREGDTLSLIPIGGDVRGVLLSGVEYPLNNENLVFGATRGLSNVFLEQTVPLEIQEGSLLVVVLHTSNSIPGGVP
ncbi:MAG: thiamine diphosphokinase [Anaerolineae bacterium]|jgi:thiamine pyrophosphokinase|nr:MAG: thiamine diphosphokinase [Anaerolineae bacterium]